MSARRRETIRPSVLHPGSPAWPSGLRRLGSDAPRRLFVHGETTLLRAPLVGLFCSQRVPGRAVVQALELAEALAQAGASVVSGFQSPVERELLTTLLRGRGGVVLCPARSIHDSVARTVWLEPLRAGRLLLLSALDGDLRRPTAALALARNRLVAALSHRVLVLHAAPGGQLWRLAREVAAWGLRLECLQHPANGDLQLLGAVPIRAPPVGITGSGASDFRGESHCVRGHGLCL